MPTASTSWSAAASSSQARTQRSSSRRVCITRCGGSRLENGDRCLAQRPRRLASRHWRESQIAQPPFASSRLAAREPEAERVENGHDRGRDRVRRPETPPVIERKEIPRRPKRRWRQEQKRCRTIAEPCQPDGERVNDRQVKHEVEERHPAEDKQRVALADADPVQAAEKQYRGTKGHEEERQRRRVLRGVEERQRGQDRIGLRAPGSWVAVQIECPDRQEACCQHEAKPQQQLATLFG